MHVIVTALVVLVCSALCLALSRALLRGVENRAKRLAVSALCLLFGVVLAISGLKYVLPLLPDRGRVAAPDSAELEGRIRSEVDRVWESHRFFQLLEEASPEAAREVRTRMNAMARSALEAGGAFRVGDMALIGDAAAKAAMPLIARASDESVTAFAGVALEQMRALRAKDPKYCLMYLFPQAFAGERMPANLSGVKNSRILDALAGILDSALHAPQEPPSRERANEALASALNTLLPRLEKRYGGREPVVAAFAAMSNPRLLPNADHAVVADVAISFYEELLRLAPKERSQALRLLFAGPQAAK